MAPTEMLRISWTAKKSNEAVLREADTKGSLMNRIRKWQAIFFCHVRRRQKLGHLVTPGMIERKRNKGIQREKMSGRG